MSEFATFERDMFSTKADRLNELPHKEVEIEFRLNKKTDLDELAKNIFSEFKGTEQLPYQISAGMPEITESLTRQLKYFTKEEEAGKTKLFTITIRHNDGAISIKKKGEKVHHDDVDSRDETEYMLPYDEWNAETESKIIAEQAKLFNISPDQINEELIHKRKLKIRVENQDSHRIYTIGVVGKTKENGKTKKSMDIQYVGMEGAEPEETEADEAENAIDHDLVAIKDIIFSSPADIRVKSSKK